MKRSMRLLFVLFALPLLVSGCIVVDDGYYRGPRHHGHGGYGFGGYGDHDHGYGGYGGRYDRRR